ncbi:MAG: phosphate ABC transporter permease subunit PstC [Thermoleophilia bacterium]
MGDRVFKSLAFLAAIGIVALMVLLVYKLYQPAAQSIGQFGLGFLTSEEWDPVNDIYGAAPFIYGTIVSSLLALLMAVPLSMGIAIYLSQFAPGWLRTPLGFMMELLAAIPSVVYGLWGIFVLAPFLGNTIEPFFVENLGFIPIFEGPVYGVGLFTAAVILAIMILPTISAISRESMLNVSHEQKEAAQALGATPWETVRMAVLPLARPGIIGAIMLGLGRALGETMAVTMVIGNRPEISASIFAPAYSIASVIANEFAEVTAGLHMSALVELALILLAITLVLNLIARLLVQKTGSRAGKGGRF